MTFANLYHHEINPREDAMHKSSLFDDWLSSYGSDTSIIMFLCSICSINTLRDSYSRVSRLNYNMNFLYYLEFFLESTKENLSFYSLSYNFYLNFFFFFDLRGVSGPAYAHHDYSPRPTRHPASPGACKAPRGWQACT